MAIPPILDPMQLWRDAIGTFEKQANSLANRSMNSEEFAAALHRVAGLSTGVQGVSRKLLGAYFKQLGLPTREEVDDLRAAVKRVEDKLDTLIAVQVEADIPRPARTRRPQEESGRPAAPAKRRRKQAR